MTDETDDSRLEIARLKRAVASALVLERYWRTRALFGAFPLTTRRRAGILPLARPRKGAA